jgi:hypothetical protein
MEPREPLAGLQPRLIRSVPSFLHFPKCGTSFEQTLAVYNGTTIPNHTPLLHEQSPSTVAAMFRQPEERLRSSYWHIRASHKYCCTADEFGYTSHERAAILNGFLANKPIADVMGQYTGCQAKMLLGHRCFSSPRWSMDNSEMVRRAISRVDRLFFVGLTSEWRLSMCLFNLKMTGFRFVTSFQMKNCRKTNLNVGALNLSASEQHRFQDLPRDEVDHGVFIHAARRFWQDANESGISISTCPVVTVSNFGCRSWWNLMAQVRAQTLSVIKCMASGTPLKTTPPVQTSPGHLNMKDGCYLSIPGQPQLPVLRLG